MNYCPSGRRLPWGECPRTEEVSVFRKCSRLNQCSIPSAEMTGVNIQVFFGPVICAAGLIISAPASAADGQWPMWRHDGRLTGYQPLPGAMKQEPRVLAKYFVGS